MDEFEALLAAQKISISDSCDFECPPRSTRTTFFRTYSSRHIARRLCFPVGTVKSRLHTVKQNFKNQLRVNGVTYVHWYDCITDYIL